MLGVGWTEMLVIGVVALIVIGPKELPALMRRVGQFAGTIRRMGQDFQRELNKTTGLNEITNLRNSVTQPLKATAEAIRKEFNTTTPTGEVKPSGAIKPADPKAESVVDEIKAAAGMTPPVAVPAAPIAAVAAAAPSTASVPTSPANLSTTPVVKAPIKGARPARVKKPAESKVETAELAPVTPKKVASKATKPAPPAPAAAKKPTAKSKAPAEDAPAPARTPAATKAKAKAPVAKTAAAGQKLAAAKPATKATAKKTS